MGLWTREGSVNLARIYLNNQSQNAKLYFGLFTNNPSDASLNNLTLSDLVEPTAVSYARTEIPPSNWVVTDELSVYPAIEYEVGLEAFGTIYGCFVATTLDNSGKLLAIHKYTTPVALNYYGDRLETTLRISMT